ncbi:hypothetical protein QBC34DRAFT_383396 [Podospora aff. communis PSN243]|uniref:Amine oxidase domain-containing protein n=1 Tax=Podospora aff. communis PSN243 TaxID=3040156 RepID=A0AAV9GCU2_9PEZI|nr:hypothetical protein QBC34DRAFT_383396 [Podospora aff. communis PSN243]
MSPNETINGVKAPTGEPLTAHTQWAAHWIRKAIADIEDKAPTSILATEKADTRHLLLVDGTLQQPDVDDSVKDEIKEFNIGIVGAGAAGLFTAMILDHLNEKYNLNARYEILGANSDDRLGCRLFSYCFKDDNGKPLGPHQYFDVGAMDRTFELFNEVGMKTPIDPAKPKPGDLIPYYFSRDAIQTTSDNINANEFKITGLPERIASANPGDLIKDQIGFWTDLYENNPKEFWKGLTSQLDQFSVFSFSNQAVSEMILESIDFDHDKPWHCVEGGAQEIAKHMLAKLNPNSFLNEGTPVLYQKSVKAISYITEGERKRVQVTVRGEEHQPPRVYHAVLNWAPLGAWNWSSDPTSVGALAYFGPGQFQSMYPGLTKTDGKHIIIGETASAHHAWVGGALESAVRGVYQFLFKHSKRSIAAHRATRAYNRDEVRKPFGPLPYEYDRTKEVGVAPGGCAGGGKGGV